MTRSTDITISTCSVAAWEIVADPISSSIFRIRLREDLAQLNVTPTQPFVVDNMLRSLANFFGMATACVHSMAEQSTATPIANRCAFVVAADSAAHVIRSQNGYEHRMKDIREHLAYLKRIATVGSNSPITEATAELARNAWWDLWEATRAALPIPTACTGPDGQMFYSWDRGRHHLELEIIPGQASEFFYCDRESGSIWSDDYVVGSRLPAELTQKLRLFF